MTDLHSLEFRCSFRITVIATNHINHYQLAKPIVQVVDPDHLLHTDTVTILSEHSDMRQAARVACDKFKEFERKLNDLVREPGSQFIEIDSLYAPCIDTDSKKALMEIDL